MVTLMQAILRKPARLVGILVAISMTFAALAGIARAHVTLETREAKLGSSYKAVFKVPHGCEGAATTVVRIDIPEGVIGVKPMPKPGWTLTTERGAYQRAYKHFHGDLAEGVKTVTWRGGPLPDEFYDEFVLSTFVAGELPTGTIHFPVTQQCEAGSIAWTEVPSPGQDAHGLKAPAPSLRLVENVKTSATAQPAPGTSTTAATIKIDAPWSRATPAGTSVAAGYVKLTNTGKAADRLLGATFERAKSVEIHTMQHEAGVMKMRELPDGVELPPGATIELKPGGMHLMMLGLSEGLKANETVKGTLRFAKAGVVDVLFSVAALGAGAPAAASQHDHHH